MPAVYTTKRTIANITPYEIKANPPEYMTVKELAAFLSISVAYVYTCMRQKQLPFLKIGGSVRFQRDAVREWIETQNQAENDA